MSAGGLAVGRNKLGTCLVVLVIFSFVIFIQFIAMIIHRLTTATHFLARAPYRYGDKYNAAYALNDRYRRLQFLTSHDYLPENDECF
ncbi:hypothetical protein DPMN_031430 [Dreissena polymorpha]|uniref:Uncharacterized protein n=1 Tax=Dreissena polymorpha TaxID=45954 RepID=A0A9D4M339_DREPO|nr:hypothetical protein DPMN_031430 [Dreissena polymorpha]